MDSGPPNNGTTRHGCLWKHSVTGGTVRGMVPIPSDAPFVLSDAKEHLARYFPDTSRRIIYRRLWHYIHLGVLNRRTGKRIFLPSTELPGGQAITVSDYEAFLEKLNERPT